MTSRADRALRTLSAGNRTLLRAMDEQALLHEMCRVIVEEGGYRMAWVGYIQHDQPKTILPVAHAGFEEGFFGSAHFTWADTGQGRSASGTAIRSGKPCVGRNLLTDPDLVAWREEAAKRSYASVSAFPLYVDAELLGNLTILAAEPDAFDEAEVKLLGELADDLSYGIASLRTRSRRKEAEAELQRVNRA